MTSPAVKQYVVSASGQMSLPAEVRHRWRLDRPRRPRSRYHVSVVVVDDHLLVDVISEAARAGSSGAQRPLT